MAANIIVARLKNLDAEIKDLLEMGDADAASERQVWCIQMRHKLQEALVRLYSMLKEHQSAVRLALTINMQQEAK